MSLSPKKTTTNTGETHSQAWNDGQNKDGDNKNSSEDCNEDASDGDLGSGLAAFFGDFFPNQRDTKDRPIGFSTGLSRLPAPTDPIENANHIEANVGIKYIDGGLMYNQWRNKEKQFLTDYLKLRLHPHPDEEITQSGDSNTSSAESSDEGEGDDGIEPESQLRMETQEPIVEEKNRLKEQGKSSGRRITRGRRITIPYVENCLHDLTKLEFLNLHTRTLSLNLSRIDRVWALRDTKRSGSLSKGSIRKPVFENCSRRPQIGLQRLVFEEKDEDGPLATVYKKVVHLEVEQLHISQVGGLGGVIGGADDFLLSSGNKRRNSGKYFQQRIKVFFYNSYANVVSEWIKEQQRKSGKKRKHDNSISTSDITSITTDIVMSLSNIPAVCIFPYFVDPRNWREKQDLVDYCVCIGDNSVAMTKKNQNDNENQIRFDSKEMEIRLMAVVTKTTTLRKPTAAGDIFTNDVFDDVDASSELILSRRTLANDFLSSSSGEGNTPGVGEFGEAREQQEVSGIVTNPLQKSWNNFKKSRTEDPSNNGKGKRNIPTPQQPTSVLNDPPDGSPTNKQISEVLRKDSDRPIIVEPMMIEGEAQRRLAIKEVDYVRLGNITNMVNQRIDAGKGCNFKVNLYASVVAVTPPRITKRGDWMVAATLMDESCLTPMTINIFCRKQEHLPKMIWMGDVIRIHRTAVEKWYNKIQLQGLKPTQYVVIRKIGGKWQVIPTAQNYFTFNRSDEERSQSLWRWANRHAESSPSMKSEHCFTLKELQQLKNKDDKDTFANRDITVMVVQKLQYRSSNANPHGLLRVWDGTGNPPSDPLFMQSRILDPPREEQRSATYPRAIEQVINTSRKLQASIDTMEIPISLCGRVSNVVVWEKSQWALIQEHIPVGTYLRLRNVHIPTKWETNNFRSIFMHDKSWMTALPTYNFEVRSLLCQHNERFRGGRDSAYNPEFVGGGGALPPLPSCRFVGIGLSRFKDQQRAKVYTGAVHVLLIQTSSRQSTSGDRTIAVQTVTVADRSGSFRVMATQKISHELRTLLPDHAVSGESLFGELDCHRRFLVRIRMIVLEDDEQKHFVLTNLAPMD